MERRQSEIDVCPNLDPSRKVLTGGFTEVTIGQIWIHAVKIGPVEGVEEIKAQLKIEALHDPRVLRQADVGVCITRLTEAIHLLIAFGARCRRRELPGAEDSIKVSLATG